MLDRGDEINNWNSRSQRGLFVFDTESVVPEQQVDGLKTAPIPFNHFLLIADSQDSDVIGSKSGFNAGNDNTDFAAA